MRPQKHFNKLSKKQILAILPCGFGIYFQVYSFWEFRGKPSENPGDPMYKF